MFRLCWVLLFLPLVCHASPPPELPSGWAAKDAAYGTHYMAVTANPHATRAAVDVLERGGNALDAAIAAQMVLGVVEPQSSGIGGGGFLLYHDAERGITRAFDGRERAPAAVTQDIFLDADGRPMPFHEARLGGRSVGVPGLLRMLEYAHDLHGRLPWQGLFGDAIGLAGDGFEVSPRLAGQLREAARHPTSKAFRELYFRNGEPAAPGTHLRNPALAETLATVAQGRNAFYEGALADAIVSAVRHNGLSPGTMTKHDLARYMPEEMALLCGGYRGYTVCSVGPPSSGGVALLQALGMLERFPLQEMKPFSPLATHYALEALKLAYADRDTHLADPDFVSVPTEALLERTYLGKRASLIGRRANPDPKPGTPSPAVRWWSHHAVDTEPPSTTHISIVDGSGNVASMTTSIEHGFGSGLVVGGFLLNNQLTDFAFIPEKDGKPVANRPEGGKKPRSTMAPVIVFDAGGKPYLVAGSPGGARIVPYVLKVLLAVLDWKMPLQEALDAPNFAAIGGVAELEETGAESLRKDLANRGHYVRATGLNSGVHAIMLTEDGIFGGADARREGTAMGR